MKLQQLHPNEGQIAGVPANPRQITDDDFAKLKKSLMQSREFLLARPIIVDEDYNILGGNMRFRALQRLAQEHTKIGAFEFTDEIPDEWVKQVHWSDAKKREFVIKDNTDYGHYDWDLIANEWSDLPLDEWGLNVVGWDDEEKESGAKVGSAVQDNFDEEKDDIAVICDRGDIWQLGEHRLMCGDSTSADDVQMLMDGVKADIAFTSPPYGVVDGSLREHKEKGKSDHADGNFYRMYNDTMSGWRELMDKSLSNMRTHTHQQFINVQMLSDNKRALMKWVADNAEYLCDIMMWDKGSAAPQIQPNILNNVFEFIFIFGESGANRVLKFGDFKGNTSAIVRESVGVNEYASIHKAVFPIALPSDIININSKASSVLDLFGGTGTTLIACEQLNRKCYMMELDPHYCDVIIARWEKLTGKTANQLQ